MGEELRRELSELVTDTNPTTGSKYYKELSRGNLEEFSKIDGSLTEKNFISHLNSKNPVGLEVMEVVSDALDKDIYIIDVRRGDLYTLGDTDLLYKGRNSVILSYTGGHYNTLGIRNGKGDLITYFSNTNPFIVTLYERMKSLIKN
jgi:hypothetical protein